MRKIKTKRLLLIYASLILAATVLIYYYVDPAPPKSFTIATGTGEGDYETYAKLYRDLIKDDGVILNLRPTSGAFENLKLLSDPKSGVDAGFVHDGLGSPEEETNLVSLGSLYYEPVWLFYRWSGKVISRLADLEGKSVALGPLGGGTRTLALRLFKASGVDEKNSHLLTEGWTEAAEALRTGIADAAVFIATPEEALIKELIADPRLRLMSMDQAEAIVRQVPFLHHLTLPHGTLDLKRNLPAQDIDLVSPTATLLVKDSLHSALAYLLLKAASEIHGEPDVFERRGEFPIDKDYSFPLSSDAKSFYKSGAPFWQRYLPFWLAILVDRFMIFVIPALALIVPLMKMIPKFFQWRIQNRIYKRYGELKYLETQIAPKANHSHYREYLNKLDKIEEHVNSMKLPIDYTEHLYSLRGHIDFVRGRIQRVLDRP